MLEYRTFTGGPFETNCYLISAPEGKILIDAPEGAAEFCRSEKVGLLLLTHAHFDHVLDAARVAREHGCPIGAHPDGWAMLSDPNSVRRLGLAYTYEPVKPTLTLREGAGQSFLGLEFDLFLVPGHCPGSICFYQPESGLLFCGDVLFSGGVGRWDLPGGDSELLFWGIREKLYKLPSQTKVLPGHGIPTTIGTEMSSNPFVRG
ncbi:MAG: MBL fold metallo-hydrolase [Chthoniobacterales bacterium]|nr:MBL fold metallo-hydrolase [Chthoniobacterales bacterium]